MANILAKLKDTIESRLESADSNEIEAVFIKASVETEKKLDPKPETKSPKRLAKITPNDKSPFDIQQGVITEKETGNIVGFAGLDSFASEITRRGKEVAA